MKPKDLVCPFRWPDRQVVIEDRVWYVPAQTETASFAFPGWDHPSLFGNNNPVAVEYCSGNGCWIAEKARQNPEINWVAVEIQFERVRKIWSKIKNHGLSNLIVLCGEGRRATECYFPDHSVSEVYINFPDPWPKARHAKHRIIQPTFVNEVWRILDGEGTMTFVTDDTTYSEWTIDAVTSHPGFVSTISDPYYRTDNDCYGDSFFKSLWLSKGKTIRYHNFRRRQLEPYHPLVPHAG